MKIDGVRLKRLLRLIGTINQHYHKYLIRFCFASGRGVFRKDRNFCFVLYALNPQ